MAKITFIANYPEMKEIAEEVFTTQGTYAQSFKEADDYILEIISASSTQAVLDHNIDSNVVVARGAIVYDLKRVGFHLPVVEVIVAGSDLVAAVNEAKQQFGNLPTAVIGSINMLAGIEQVSKAMGVHLQPYYLKENSLHEVIEKVEKAESDGCKTIIGGNNGCRHARTLGLHAVLIRSGRESISQAISEAKRIADISIVEQQKTLVYKTIMDYVTEGIIAVDLTQTILVCNDIGQKILGMPRETEKYINKHIDSVIQNREIASLIKEDRELVAETVKFDNQYLTFNNVPVKMNGKRIGRVFTFQNVSRVQELEGKIRGKIYSKGHRAKYSITDILGNSPQITKAKFTCKQYAAVDSNVLIIGETGTGKELFAQSIHMLSSRSNESFVAINCAALSEGLLESELFGYVEGAFTGATKKGKKGLFELAHNGTIFLDEISEIPLSLQAKLLRVIQEQEVIPIGHDRVLPINVRVISATNKELKILTQNGEFREDLYFRLNVFTLRIPPLRQRQGDIMLLAKEFLSHFAELYGRKAPVVDEKAIQLLVQYEWTGNVRELRNMCERLAALNLTGTITDIDIKEHLDTQYIQHPHQNEEPKEKTTLPFREQERQLIQEALKSTSFNKTKAAQILGISRVTLWRKIQELDLDV
ncbi:MAG: sigma 54-interacting transcriptional regulator [Sphaerochaeta sp.]|nr:sigma 54-interacting transcriptional regulator [Sphaerochaeta sp.]